ncbi:hypothetical protein TSUD_313760 [Trifolium subterraneum]|uniref:Uncharacterized protein n=1 Tax=Trifolium subterraneum TaxID=3900 RepID=A0A2Z6M385_TRISU|nr:hypothetical protein TSUD_313760 [Trifolium subterraneum]
MRQEFSTLVDDLRECEWQPSPREKDFLRSLIYLRGEMVADAPFITLVEEAEQLNQELLFGVFDQMWMTKEGMRMYEGNLVASFHEEEMIDRRAGKLQGDLAKLQGEKEDHQRSIRQDVASLLEKRETLLALKARQRELGEALSGVMDDMNLVNHCVTDKGEFVNADGVKGLGKGPVPEVVKHGDSSKFDAMGIPELRKLCIGQGLKSVVLSHLMSVRQDKEVQEASAKVVELEKTVSTLQSSHDKEEARMKKEIDSLKKEKEADATKLKKDKEDSLAELQMKHDAAVDLVKKEHAEDVASLGRANANLVCLRNACIVALCQHARDAALTLEDMKDLEDENAALKEEMTDKYVDGFSFAVEQMRVVFPNVDPSLLAELDFMKKSEGGRLVPR